MKHVELSNFYTELEDRRNEKTHPHCYLDSEKQKRTAELGLAVIRGAEIRSYCTTLPETNIAPEKRPSQKETSIPTIDFQVLC